MPSLRLESVGRRDGPSLAPTDSSLRSASVFDGAPQIKIKSDSLRIVDTQSAVGAGLPAKNVRPPRFV